MATAVIFPKVSLETDAGTIARWLKDDGAQVEQGAEFGGRDRFRRGRGFRHGSATSAAVDQRRGARLGGGQLYRHARQVRRLLRRANHLFHHPTSGGWYGLGRREVAATAATKLPALGIPAAQVQVVTPVHRGGAGTQALNAALKAVLNPGGGKRTFDPGDRVVATANHLEAEPVGYANGEVGVVDEVQSDGTVVVEFASGPAAVKGKALRDLLHGWAITVHRAQGSEFPAVVVALPPEASGMLSRPLVYTALTRAQKHLSIVHAAGPVVARAVKQIGAVPRRTRLVPLLRNYLPPRK